MNEGKIRKQYRSAAKLLIKARQAEGNSFILLDYLYTTLGVDNPIAGNGVRWAVQGLKEEGVLSATSVRGVYSFQTSN